jgi:hypothetical protein
VDEAYARILQGAHAGTYTSVSETAIIFVFGSGIADPRIAFGLLKAIGLVLGAKVIPSGNGSIVVETCYEILGTTTAP